MLAPQKAEKNAHSTLAVLQLVVGVLSADDADDADGKAPEAASSFDSPSPSSSIKTFSEGWSDGLLNFKCIYNNIDHPGLFPTYAIIRDYNAPFPQSGRYPFQSTG